MAIIKAARSPPASMNAIPRAALGNSANARETDEWKGFMEGSPSDRPAQAQRL